MSAPRFTISAGRLIVRDGAPFVSLARCLSTSPVEADEFAKAIVRAANSHEALLAAVRYMIPRAHRHLCDNAELLKAVEAVAAAEAEVTWTLEPGFSGRAES